MTKIRGEKKYWLVRQTHGGREIHQRRGQGVAREPAHRRGPSPSPQRQTAAAAGTAASGRAPKGNLYLLGDPAPADRACGAPPASHRRWASRSAWRSQGRAGATGFKWPNDVPVNGRKVAGVLTESMVAGAKLAAVIVGIGINVGAELLTSSPKSGRPSPRESGRNVRKEDVERALFDAMTSVYRRFFDGGFAKCCTRTGNRVTLLDRRCFCTFTIELLIQGECSIQSKPFNWKVAFGRYCRR